MASEVAIGKRAKISEAQQYMILAVLGAAIFLGVAISLVSHFLKVISFNTKIIMGEEQAIAAYQQAVDTDPEGAYGTTAFAQTRLDELTSPSEEQADGEQADEAATEETEAEQGTSDESEVSDEGTSN